MATGNTVLLAVYGMSCGGCKKGLETALAQDPAVATVTINLATQVATITAKANTQLQANDLIAVVKNTDAKFDAAVIDDPFTDNLTPQLYRPYVKRAMVGLLPGIVLLLLLLLGVIPALTLLTGQLVAIGLAVLSVGVMVYSGSDFYTSAWHSLKTRRYDMNTLIALSTVSAFALSLLVILFAASLPLVALHVHFIPILIILGIVNAGLAMRGWMKYRIGKKLPSLRDKFYELQPQAARISDVMTRQTRSIPVAQVKLGDRIVVKKNERFPVPGKIVSYKGGAVAQVQTLFDNGEPLSNKRINDMVCVGDLNLGEEITIQASAAGDALSLLTQLNYLGAETQPLPLVDKASAYFVPIVLVLALLNLGVWLVLGPAPALYYAAVTTLSVLLSACPCSLGLAAPLSTTIALRKLADRGILVRDPMALDTLRHAKTIVFDKTGTLTDGQFSVHAMVLQRDSIARTELLQSLASLEQVSSHPLAKAIVREARAQKLDLLEPTAIEGNDSNGLSGQVDGKRICIGNAAYIKQQLSGDIPAIDRESIEAGNTRLYIAVDGAYQGYVDLQDKLRADAKTVVTTLQKRGYRIVMLTGAEKTEAMRIARELDIDEGDVHAEQKPADKKQIIERLRRQTQQPVIMVGDGLNDGAAMCAADLGVAIDASTHVIVHAKVSLPNQLGALLHTLALGRACSENVQWNVRFSLYYYNPISLLLAAGILFPVCGLLLPPYLAALMMMLSSLIVMCNAYRLFALSDAIFADRESLSWFAWGRARYRALDTSYRLLAGMALVSTVCFGLGTMCSMAHGANLMMAWHCLLAMHSMQCVLCGALLLGYVGFGLTAIVATVLLAKKIHSRWQAQHTPSSLGPQQSIQVLTPAALTPKMIAWGGGGGGHSYYQQVDSSPTVAQEQSTSSAPVPTPLPTRPGGGR